MKNPVILHCNYVEQGQSIDRMCELASRWGFDGVEFRRKRGGVDETPEGYLDAVATAVKKYGIRHVLFGAPGPDLTNPDADACKREVENYIAFYRLATKRFQLSVCNTMAGAMATKDVPYMEFDKHGSNVATDAQWEAAVKGFQTIGDAMSEMGVRLAFETHNVYIHDLAAAARKLVDLIDRDSVGINLDFGNILIHPDGESLEKSIDICRGRIYLLHLKNLRIIPDRRYWKWITSALGEGDINNRVYLRMVKEQGYDGPVVIEAPRPGDREWFAQQDLEYIRSLMAELG